MDTATLTAPTDQQLLAEVERFLDESGMAQTRFGIETMREGGLVESLRRGRSLSLRNANKVLSFIADWKASSAPDRSASATNSGEIVCGDADRGQAAAEAAPRPFAPPSSPTCSETSEPPLPLPASAASSVGEAI